MVFNLKNDEQNISELNSLIDNSIQTELSSKTSLTNEESFDESDQAAIEFFSSIMSRNTEHAYKAMTEKDVMKNVAIFVDYDNVYWTMYNSYNHDPDSEDAEKNLFHKLWERYGKDNVRTFRAYADFEKVRTKLTSLQKKRIQIRHVYSNDKQVDYRKNSSDIELCIDAVESTYKDSSISCYVIVTADSDMIPILSRLMYKGKRVELFYLSTALPQHINMTNFAHHSEDLLEFLNVQVETFDVEDYILKALEFINDWHVNFSETDKFLGTSWLKTQLANTLTIAPNKVSELIETLQTTEYIYDGVKETLTGKKTSLMLTEKGKEFLNKDEELVDSK